MMFQKKSLHENKINKKNLNISLLQFRITLRYILNAKFIQIYNVYAIYSSLNTICHVLKINYYIYLRCCERQYFYPITSSQLSNHPKWTSAKLDEMSLHLKSEMLHFHQLNYNNLITWWRYFGINWLKTNRIPIYSSITIKA